MYWICWLASSQAIFAQQTTTVVRGIVHDSAGAGIARAQVFIAGVTAPAITGADGRFSITAPTGVALLTVRRLGFQPGEMEIETSGGYPVDIALTPVARALEPVVVHARREASDVRLAGFEQRLARREGRFITRDQIDRTPDARLVEALRRFPGVRVVTLRGASGHTVTLGRSNCAPLVFLDGFPALAGVFDLDMIELASLEGVEVYSSAATIPSELIGPRGPDPCGVIGLWTRTSRPEVNADNETVDLTALVAAHAVFTAQDVDVAATYERGSADPAYPGALLQARVRGRVVIEFVVDTLGTVEKSSITVVTASNSAFAEAARASVTRGKFSPAVFNGRRVRQIVRLGVDFDPRALSTPADTSGAKELQIPRFSRDDDDSFFAQDDNRCAQDDDATG
jgi:TonB family protein